MADVKSNADRFFLRAIEDDLKVHADGVDYTMMMGDVIAVKKIRSNMDTFSHDVENGLLEVISEDVYNRSVKNDRVAKKIKYREVGIDKFEKMITDAGKSKEEGKGG